jgi:uncharacterized protein YceK
MSQVSLNQRIKKREFDKSMCGNMYPFIYSGTYMNGFIIKCALTGKNANGSYGDNGCFQYLPVLVVDLPASFVADTILLPLTNYEYKLNCQQKSIFQ